MEVGTDLAAGRFFPLFLLVPLLGEADLALLLLCFCCGHGIFAGPFFDTTAALYILFYLFCWCLDCGGLKRMTMGLVCVFFPLSGLPCRFIHINVLGVFLMELEFIASFWTAKVFPNIEYSRSLERCTHSGWLNDHESFGIEHCGFILSVSLFDTACVV